MFGGAGLDRAIREGNPVAVHEGYLSLSASNSHTVDKGASVTGVGDVQQRVGSSSSSVRCAYRSIASEGEKGMRGRHDA